MSESNKVRKMLSQAGSFVVDAPLEAVSRVKLARSTAEGALATASSDERAALQTLIEVANARLERYELKLAAWTVQNQQRADLFGQHERERLQQPIPPKV